MEKLIEYDTHKILKMYYAEIARYKPVDRNEEKLLARKIKAGDLNSLHKLVKSNLKFVIVVAKKYSTYGVNLIDLINIGNMGLISAALKFDEKRNIRFISYAVWWIRHYIIQAIASQKKIINLPVYKLFEILKYNKIINSLAHHYNREPSVSEIADYCNVDRSKVAFNLSLNQEEIFLDKPVGKADESTLVQLLEDKNERPADFDAIDRSINKIVNNHLKSLTKREQEILALYFGLNNNNPHTLEEIGKILKISSERIRQIKKSALRKLRNIHLRRIYVDCFCH
jgi:RNA polymerase primary sigma factor